VVIALSHFGVLDFLGEMLSDNESNNDVQLTINEHYAQVYKAKKEREELQKRS
jgi:hypothetical protein